MKFTIRLIVVTLWLNAGLATATPQIELVAEFGNRTFAKPLAMYQAPDSRDWFVVEQAGRILRVNTDKKVARVFADISTRIDSEPNEAGLLGLAFHPRFSSNRRVFLSYTAGGDPLISIVAEYRSNKTGDRLEADSERIVLQLDQPFGNHNGGQISFGTDGYLYIGFGDGGAAGDPRGNGQNTNTLLGALLRLDVDHEKPYTVPADNPFYSRDGRAEIYAYGLRNPWRWSFDRKTGELWLADVGQNKWEEINRISKGGNYGWNIREGRHCFRDRQCSNKKLIDPIAEYSHDQGCSVTGGYVYRGKKIPLLAGWYVFADYCSGTIWGFDTQQTPAQVMQILKTETNISSFAEAHDGELFILDHGKGGIFRLVPGR